jgi:hypothetical protein
VPGTHTIPELLLTVTEVELVTVEFVVETTVLETDTVLAPPPESVDSSTGSVNPLAQELNNKKTKYLFIVQ